MLHQLHQDWGSAPSYAAALDRSHPASAGVDLLVVGNFARREGGMAVPTSDNATQTLTGTPWGPAASYGTTTRLNWNSTVNAWFSQQTFTRSILIDLDAGQNGVIWQQDLRSVLAAGTTIGLAAGEVGYQWYDGAAFRTLNAGTRSGLLLIDVVSLQGVGHWLYVNGQLAASDSLTANTTYAGARDGGIGYRTTATAVNGVTMRVLMFRNQRNVALSPGEISNVWSNPWAIFEPEPVSLYWAPASSVNGTGAITEAGDTLSSTATVDVAAAGAITEAGDTLASEGIVGSVPVEATGAITEAGDTLSSTATVDVAAAGAITEAGDTLSSAATVDIAAAGAITEAGDTIAGEGTVASSTPVSAVGAITEAGDTLSAAGSTGVFVEGNVFTFYARSRPTMWLARTKPTTWIARRAA